MISTHLRFGRRMLMYIFPLMVTMPAISGTPRLEVPRTPQPVKIGLTTSNDIWSSAAVAPLVFNNGLSSGTRPERSSKVRIMWDSAFLYLRFEFESSNVKKFYTKHDDDVWGNAKRLDIAEAILDPQEAGTRYFEINATPGGGVLDCLVVWSDGKPSWDRNWPKQPLPIVARDTVPSDGFTGWICEMAVPWKTMECEPKTGMHIRANFHRADSDFATPYLSWSPTGEPFFHIPGKFGTIVLTDKKEQVQ